MAARGKKAKVVTTHKTMGSCVMNGDDGGIKKLLEAKADPNLTVADVCTLITAAVLYRHVVMRHCCNRSLTRVCGAQSKETPLHLACTYGSPECVKLLLQYKVHHHLVRCCCAVL